MHTTKEEAFQKFTDQYGGAARSFALRLTRNRDDAEDIYQEAIIRAWRAYDPSARRQPGKAWLNQIVFNCFVDHRRRIGCRPTTYSIEGLQAQNQHFDVVDPTTHRDTAEPDHRKLIRALDSLTPDQRALIVAHFFSNVTYAELAGLHGTKESTIKTRVNRAILVLRRLLKTEEQSEQTA